VKHVSEIRNHVSDLFIRELTLERWHGTLSVCDGVHKLLIGLGLLEFIRFEVGRLWIKGDRSNAVSFPFITVTGHAQLLVDIVRVNDIQHLLVQNLVSHVIWTTTLVFFLNAGTNFSQM